MTLSQWLGFLIFQLSKDGVKLSNRGYLTSDSAVRFALKSLRLKRVDRRSTCSAV